MAVRFKKPCHNCPEAEAQRRQGFSENLPAGPPIPSLPTIAAGTPLAITCDTEGERLWRHVIFGTGTCVSMIEGYHALGMPGNPKAGLVELRDRLQALIDKCEATDASDVLPERKSPDGEDHRSDTDVEQRDDPGQPPSFG